MNRLELAIADLKKARLHTATLLDNIDVNDWFKVPPAGGSHIGWQVAHIAMAEYRLCLERVCGHDLSHTQVVSDAFLKQFGRGSVADPDPKNNPSADEIRQVFDNVHKLALLELASVTDASLDDSINPPHPRFDTKFGALRWAAMHEMIHAGQIGLLRRQLGGAALW